MYILLTVKIWHFICVLCNCLRCVWQHTHTHTHTRLTALCPGLPRRAGTRKVKPIWILLKQETVSGSGIHWALCKSAPRSRQITMPAPHCSVFYRPDALSAAQPTVSKHWRQSWQHQNKRKILQLLLMLLLLLFSCCVCQTSTSSRRCCCLDYQVFSVMLARHRYDATTLPARVAAGNSVLNLSDSTFTRSSADVWPPVVVQIIAAVVRLRMP